jgi:hypothetical protein
MSDTRTITLAGRAVQIELSGAARAALAGRRAPLVVEMELYFSCLIRKRVRFLDTPHPDALSTAVDDRLTVSFRPVMTRACAVDSVVDKPELAAFPIRRPEAFVPRRLRVDYRHDAWAGEYVL